MIRVDILDRSPVFTHGLIHVLSQAGIVGLAADRTANVSPDLPVDVSVVDPGVLGAEGTLGFIAARTRHNPVLALVDDASGGWRAAWLRAGAAQVLHRYADPDTLIREILAAAARLAPADATSRARPKQPARRKQAAAANQAERPEPGAQADQPQAALSGRETEVLRLIADGLTHHQVARRLGISGHTVDTYVKRIRIKLEVGSKAELIRMAVQGGLLST